jgi:hypothetical protein
MLQNTVLFHMSDQGFIGETEVSSQGILGEFSAGGSRRRIVVEDDLM